MQKKPMMSKVSAFWQENGSRLGLGIEGFRNTNITCLVFMLCSGPAVSLLSLSKEN